MAIQRTTVQQYGSEYLLLLSHEPSKISIAPTTIGSVFSLGVSTRVRYSPRAHQDTCQRNQPDFGDATSGFPAKKCPRNERRNSVLMTRHYPDLGSASDWSCHVGNLIQPPDKSLSGG